MIATSNLNQIKSFKSYGKSIGICFQLIDDYLDYKGDKKIMGKLIGNDFFNSKLTYPIIITLNEGTYFEKEKIENLFKKKQKTQNDLKLILEILDNNMDNLQIMGFENKFDAMRSVYDMTDQFHKDINGGVE